MASYLFRRHRSFEEDCRLMNSVLEHAESSDVQRLRAVGVPELAEQFAKALDRLKRMIDLRLDRKLLGRVDASDVAQETFIEAARRLPEYLASPKVSPYMWLRQVCRQMITVHYRARVGTAKRAVDREVVSRQLGSTTSGSLVGELAGSMMSPQSQVAKAELMDQL